MEFRHRCRIYTRTIFEALERRKKEFARASKTKIRSFFFFCFIVFKDAVYFHWNLKLTVAQCNSLDYNASEYRADRIGLDWIGLDFGLV